MTNRVVVCNGEVNWIGKCERRVAFTVVTVTACTVKFVDSREVTHLLRFQLNISLSWFAWWPAAYANQERDKAKGE